MTKKDYILIAKVFKDYLDNGDNDQLDGIASADILARKLSIELAHDNPLFDSNRFLNACGLY